jgi:hypothetical protein
LYGQLITDENCPTVAASWARETAAAKKSDAKSESSTAKRRSAANGTCDRPEESDDRRMAVIS